MSDVNLFLRKRNQKGKQRAVSRPVPTPISRNALVPPNSTSGAPSPASQSNGSPAASTSSQVKTEGETVEIKLYSTAPNSGLRFNLMKMNSLRDVDPTTISSPVLMNRKQPGPKQPPQYAFDEEGKLIGRFLYDPKGGAILDEDGKPTIEKREEMDMSLVGVAPGDGKRKSFKKGTKEVFHQDKEIIRLRREETDPWVLESGKPSKEKSQPEHWVGRMMEPSTLPTVLFINTGENGFSVYPLGRTYRFEPDRPFKVLDSDAAHKLYEQQAKYKVQDRWGQRPDAGPSSSSATSLALPTGATATPARPIKMEIKQEQRAMRMEERINSKKGVRQRAARVERFDDDYKAEKRQMGRGMEGEADEELDFDVNEDFQDDEDNNTFYRDENEEEEAKVLEERLKKEFRLANANVGDKPQIEDVEPSDDEDLFGDPKLNKEGKKLRKMMKKRRKENESDEDMESSDSEDSDDELDKSKDQSKPADPSTEDKTNPDGTLKNPTSTNNTNPNPTPTHSRPPTPTKLAGSGSALLAQRAASRGASPHRSRAGSPLNPRAGSPDAPGGRSGSPVNSVSRSGSPAPGSGAGGIGTPSSGGGGLNRPKNSKRKTTSESPLRDSLNPLTTGVSGPSSSNSHSNPSVNSPNKRKTLEPSPTPSNASTSNPSRKKKKSSSSTPTPGTGPGTPLPEIEPFVGMITQSEILDFFRKQGDKAVPMALAITAFRDRIVSAGPRKGDNQTLFLRLVKMVTDSVEGKMLRIKKEFL